MRVEWFNPEKREWEAAPAGCVIESIGAVTMAGEYTPFHTMVRSVHGSVPQSGDEPEGEQSAPSIPKPEDIVLVPMAIVLLLLMAGAFVLGIAGLAQGFRLMWNLIDIGPRI